MNYTIRQIRPSEYGVLETFLYEAIFVPKGTKPPDRSIIHRPELSLYIRDFGQRDDHALVAEVDGRIVGAVWARIMEDYGHVDDNTPSLAISLLKSYRGMGIGKALMKGMLALLKEKGYAKASLAVQQANDAVRLYQRVGFQIVDRNQEEYIMVCDLKASASGLPEGE